MTKGLGIEKTVFLSLTLWFCSNIFLAFGSHATLNEHAQKTEV